MHSTPRSAPRVLPRLRALLLLAALVVGAMAAPVGARGSPGSTTPAPVEFAPAVQEAGSSVAEQIEPGVDRLRERLDELRAVLPLVAVAAGILLLTVLLAVWVGRWDPLLGRVAPNVFVQAVVRQALRAVILLAGLLLVVEILGATSLLGAVLGTAGIAGVALGFAFKDIVENYLAGVLLSLRQPFAPDDVVRVAESEGKVVRLTSRETILMSLEGNHIRIPNATVFRSVLVNFTRNPLRRFEVRLAVAPDTELRRALDAGVRVLREMKGVRDEPAPWGWVVDVGDSWVTLAWTGWVDQTEADYLKVRSEGVRLILGGLTAAGVEMPPPEHRVRVLRGPEAAPVAAPEPAEAQLDVSVDRSLDRQIEADRAASGEENLLREGDRP